MNDSDVRHIEPMRARHGAAGRQKAQWRTIAALVIPATRVLAVLSPAEQVGPWRSGRSPGHAGVRGRSQQPSKQSRSHDDRPQITAASARVLMT
jgi:hypothetical protein